MKPLYDPSNGKMRVAGLMSGSGSNLRKIIEQERALGYDCPYKVVIVFSNKTDSNLSSIIGDYGVPGVLRDMGDFYAAKGAPRKDMAVRAEFDHKTARLLRDFHVDVVAYAGYMSIVTAELVDSFLGVNVHPADLTIRKGGKPAYTGDRAVRDAILAGESQLRSSTHMIARDVDCGQVLMVSEPLDVRLEGQIDLSDKDLAAKVAQEHQDRLKAVGDWVIFPKTLLYLAQGRYARDESGALHFDGKPVPDGLRL